MPEDHLLRRATSLTYNSSPIYAEFCFETSSGWSGGLLGNRNPKNTKAYQAGGKTVRCLCDKGFSIWIMHHQNLTAIHTGGGRFLCIQIQAQQAHAALQGITWSPVKTLPIWVSYSSFFPRVLLHKIIWFAWFVRIWGRTHWNNLLTPWDRSRTSSERATEMVRKQNSLVPGSLFLSVFPPCAHHHSSWLFFLRQQTWGQQSQQNTCGFFGFFPPRASRFAG